MIESDREFIKALIEMIEEQELNDVDFGEDVNGVDLSQNMAIEMYGKEHQTMIAIEEMSELIKEISKDYRGKDNHDKIVEEMADVYICLEQLQLIYGIEDEELDFMVDQKMTRNYERMISELMEKWKSE